MVNHIDWEETIPQGFTPSSSFLGKWQMLPTA